MSTKRMSALTMFVVGSGVLALISSQASADPWGDGWEYRREITINHIKIDSDFTNFPVLINFDSDTDLASKAQADGNDILFTDADSNQLDYEIEDFNGLSGKLVAWVEVPIVSSGNDTVLYMYYGNPMASSQENPQAVWDANYVVVQHLNETSGICFDSTINDNDANGLNGVTLDAVGRIDGADGFDGLDDFIDIGTDASLDVFGPGQDFSIFAWVKRNGTTDVEAFLSSGSSGSNGIFFGSAHNNEDDLKFMSVGNTVEIESTNGAIGDTDWHYAGVTADRDGNLSLWRDGIAVHSESIASHSTENWNRVDDTYKIGTDRSESSPVAGIIDEVRVSNIVRSSDWIVAQFRNQDDPSTFYTVGNEQEPNTPIISDEGPADGSTGVSTSLSQLSFRVEDPENDLMNYTVTTTPDIGSASVSGVSEGTHTVSISGLDYNTTYSWTVNVTDGTHPASAVFSFTTEVNIPSISNESPQDGAVDVAMNPELSAEILDTQGDYVNWQIWTDASSSWQMVADGNLPAGSGTVSTAGMNMDQYNTEYSWKVRATDNGDDWNEQIYTFTTRENKISFAAFTDTHIGGLIETGWGMAEHLDLLAQDVMDATVPCDFTVHLGDIIMHSTAYVQGESLPTRFDQYKNNFKSFLLQHINMPFMAVAGNHDLNDYYGESHSGYPHNGHDPFNLVREIIDATEMNSYPFSFMKNNILFISLPETDYHMFTKPIIYEYVEYMVQAYPDNTTIILSHQAIEDTTVHDGSGSETYRGKQDTGWWARLFRNNPQIKMWIHGHQHMIDWYKSDRSSGLSHPVEDFGHEMVFSMPYSQADWGNYFEEDRIVIYGISADGFTTRTWENNGSGGSWVSGYDNDWDIETTYDEAAEDWYSFAIFVQDGEIQLTDMKILSPNMTLELIGTRPMELFYDPNMATQGTSWGGENILGFGNDYYAEASPSLPGMTVHGPADLDFPPKYPGSDFQGGGGAYHEDGRTGQPYQFFPVGTTHAGIPGESYTITMIARSTSGTGAVDLTMSVADHGSGTHRSTLTGSEQVVFSNSFGTEFETVVGTYTVPNDPNAWFLQGYLDFVDTTDYDVLLFSIKRLQDSSTTDNFQLSLNDTWYSHTGTLNRFETSQFTLDPTTLSDTNGVIKINSNIEGNCFGMARMIYKTPVLMGRNARFQVNSVSANTYDITLKQDLSYYLDTFKMFPLSMKYNPIEVAGDVSAQVKTSDNGNEWIESNTPNGGDVSLQITYGPVAASISNESPENGSTAVAFNPTLSAYLSDPQDDSIDWEILSDDLGSFQIVASGTLPSGPGTVSHTPSDMNEYDTTYSWKVRAKDAGTDEWVERTYSFTTELAPGVWNDPNWIFRKKILIDHTKVVDDLTDFAVLVDIIDANIGTYAQSDADDILFTDYSGNELYHEIESYEALSPSHLVTWVNIPSLSSTADTILYLYYGNSDAANQQNPQAVWDANYVMVQHLNEISGTHFDSTSNGNDGTAQNGLNQDAAGLIDGADNFAGVDEFVDVGTDSSLNVFGANQDFSVFGWVARDDTGRVDGFFASGSDGTKGIFFGSSSDNENELRFMSKSTAVSIDSTNGAINDNNWHHVGVTADRDGNINLWADGAAVATEDISSSAGENWNRSDDTYKIGTDRSELNPMDGIIDEVRVSDIVRSTAWIKTAYNNQSNPGTFYSVADAELAAGADSPIISTPFPADASTEVSIDLSELRFKLLDSQGDPMDYNVTTTPDIGSGSNTAVTNGTYSVAVSTLDYDTTYSWTVNASDNGIDWVEKTYTFTTSSGPGVWYSQDWLYRKEIVIDHDKVDDDLVSFPFLVDTSDSNLAAMAQPDGNDILFTNSDNLDLSHEIESYDAGHLVVWINIPLLSSTEDTVLYMYYGNPSASNQQDPQNVWDSDYVMVQHLEEASGTHYDSTAYLNDATTVVVTDQNAAGLFDGADDLDGTDDYMRVLNDVSLQFGQDSFTAEAWIFSNSVPDAGGARIVNNRGTGAGGTYKGWQLKINNSSGRWVLNDTSIDDGTGSYKAYTGTTSYTYNEWHHLVMVYEADSELRLYVDGTLDGTLAVGSYASITNALPTVIGGSIVHSGVEGADNKQFFDGIIDEVRLSNIARAPAWITAGYNNQSDPDLFYTIASQEQATVQYTITTSAGANGSIDPNGLIVRDYDSDQVFTATADTGYEVDEWSVDGSAVRTGGTSYTLSNIAADHTVIVTFKPLTYTITASAGANGSIDPNGLIVRDYGSDQVFTATPNTDYTVNQWFVDSGPVQPGGTEYTLNDIQSNSTVSVAFRHITDLYFDSVIDEYDLEILANNWLAAVSDSLDIHDDGKIDLLDFSILAEHWLEEL